QTGSLCSTSTVQSTVTNGGVRDDSQIQWDRISSGYVVELHQQGEMIGRQGVQDGRLARMKAAAPRRPDVVNAPVGGGRGKRESLARPGAANIRGAVFPGIDPDFHLLRRVEPAVLEPGGGKGGGEGAVA